MNLDWNIKVEELPLRYTWRLSRNATDVKNNVFVSINYQNILFLGESAPNVRYGESAENQLFQFNNIKLKLSNCQDLTQVSTLCQSSLIESSLQYAIETAFIKYYCFDQKKSLSDFLGIHVTHHSETAYTIPIMEVSDLESFFNQENLARFKVIKLKINQENGFEAIQVISKYTNAKLIVDANEAFTDAKSYLKLSEKVIQYNIAFFEQPFPAYLEVEQLKAFQSSQHLIFADESITRGYIDWQSIQKRYHGVNIKLQKSGNILEGINTILEAKKNELQTMVGCMVETTIGLEIAFYVSQITDYVDLDSFMLIKNEKYQILKENNGQINL